MRNFNYRNEDWIQIVGDHESDDFIDIIHDNFLKLLVREPTREDNAGELDSITRCRPGEGKRKDK